MHHIVFLIIVLSLLGTSLVNSIEPKPNPQGLAREIIETRDDSSNSTNLSVEVDALFLSSNYTETDNRVEVPSLIVSHQQTPPPNPPPEQPHSKESSDATEWLNRLLLLLQLILLMSLLALNEILKKYYKPDDDQDGNSPAIACINRLDPTLSENFAPEDANHQSDSSNQNIAEDIEALVAAVTIDSETELVADVFSEEFNHPMMVVANESNEEISEVLESFEPEVDNSNLTVSINEDVTDIVPYDPSISNDNEAVQETISTSTMSRTPPRLNSEVISGLNIPIEIVSPTSSGYDIVTPYNRIIPMESISGESNYGMLSVPRLSEISMFSPIIRSRTQSVNSLVSSINDGYSSYGEIIAPSSPGFGIDESMFSHSHSHSFHDSSSARITISQLQTTYDRTDGDIRTEVQPSSAPPSISPERASRQTIGYRRQ